MIINMKGEEKTLKFGVGFVRKLDDLYKAQVEGIEFGVGLTVAHMHMAQRNPAALADVIRCAIPRGSTVVAVDQFVEQYAEENDGLEELFKGVEEALGKSSVVKSTMKKAKEVAKKVKSEQSQK